MTKQPILIASILAVSLTIVFLISAILSPVNENDFKIAYEKCCNKMQCTDTYYDAETDECVFVLCQNSFFTDKEDCRYKPK